VLTSCNGYVYSMGAALLDLDEPWKVIHRAGKPYLLSPQTLYECVGDVPNVVFPCAALADAAHRPHRHLLRGSRHGDRPGVPTSLLLFPLATNCKHFNFAGTQIFFGGCPHARHQASSN
jgi:hypothetical protein